MSRESEREMNKEVLTFLSGPNMNEAPLAASILPVIYRESKEGYNDRNKSKDTPAEEDLDGGKDPIVDFLIKDSINEMPLAPVDSRTGARR